MLYIDLNKRTHKQIGTYIKWDKLKNLSVNIGIDNFKNKMREDKKHWKYIKQKQVDK